MLRDSCRDSPDTPLEAALLPRGRPRLSRVAAGRLQAPALPRGLLRHPLERGTERPGGQDAAGGKLQGYKVGKSGDGEFMKVARVTGAQRDNDRA